MKRPERGRSIFQSRVAHRTQMMMVVRAMTTASAETAEVGVTNTADLPATVRRTMARGPSPPILTTTSLIMDDRVGRREPRSAGVRMTVPIRMDQTASWIEEGSAGNPRLSRRRNAAVAGMKATIMIARIRVRAAVVPIRIRTTTGTDDPENVVIVTGNDILESRPSFGPQMTSSREP